MIIQGMNASVLPACAPLQVLAGVYGAVHGAVHLPHLGVIRVTGADAASFLQGQLTQDVLTMAVGETRLAAFCSAKGRVQATFQMLKQLDAEGQAEFLLLCSRDLAPATAKRLAMFVMRAKAKLSDASETLAVYGVAGDAINSVAAYAHSERPGSDISVNSWLTLTPVGGVARALWITPASVAPDLTLSNAGLQNAPIPGATLVNAVPMTLSDWLWLEVMSGIARVTSATVDAFVPQMLNYESLNGVNFKKGCYPGQEVVARSQFRGTLKRRAYCVQSAVALAAGDEVFGPADAEQACGTVVLAAQVPGGPSAGFNAIVSMQVSAAASGGLTAKSAGGAALELLALPYVLLDDV